jgi:hypothetical protein
MKYKKLFALLMTAGLLSGCALTIPFTTGKELVPDRSSHAVSSVSEDPDAAGDLYDADSGDYEEEDPFEADSDGEDMDELSGGENAFTENGTYKIADGWETSDKYSTDQKTFYLREGETDMDQPDNISVEQGTNRYSAENVMGFKDAIMRQMGHMTKGQKVDEIKGRGYTTDKKVKVLMIQMIDDESVTTQYYLCGDYRYVLIHETNYSGAEDADEAAKEMVESFEWMD